MMDANQKALLRAIPKVDELMAEPALSALEHALCLSAVRAELQALRERILCGGCRAIPDTAALTTAISRRAEQARKGSLVRVINATGVVLHTNLGRAPLAYSAAVAAAQAAQGYVNLEYDLAEGARGSRHDHAADLLTRLTGAQDAIVVNNNAAAVLLTLSALANGKEAPVSRGELVEIGGAFRVPEVMAQSGCILKEVGATNRTRVEDYENAIHPERTALILKVHTSNYRITGFTEEASLASLSALAKRHGIPLVYDLGSGRLSPQYYSPALHEPTVTQSLRAGADIVCFSADKLLGGPQAGIILGGSALIARLRRHPLMRAVRIDKLALAALAQTLRLYLEPGKARQEIPVLRMLAQSPRALGERAERVKQKLPGIDLTIVQTQGQIGGGSAPLYAHPSIALRVEEARPGAVLLEERLRLCDTPVLARIERGKLYLDMLAVADEDVDALAAALLHALSHS